MKNESLALTVLLSLGTVAGVGCGGGSSYTAPGATTGTSESEIPGVHDANDLNPILAQSYVDHVRVGHEVDPTGAVPPTQEATKFGADQPVHISMDVSDAPAGSKIRVVIVDTSTNTRIWQAEKPVEAGRSHLNFRISDGELARGEYRADVIIGDETVAGRSFAVIQRQA